jgi:hypothetical protein
MTMPPGEGDRTLPAPSPGRGVAGGEPTVPAGGGPPPGGPPPVGAGGPSDRGALLLLSGSTLAGLVLGALLALVVGNGGSGHPTATTASSTTSTSTTSTSSTTTSTTTPAGPQILSFNATPSSPSCLPGSTVQLSWQVQNAVSVAITDNGSSIGTFSQPTSSRTVAFHCPPTGHTYVLTATSSAGRQAARDASVTGTVLPSTSAATTTTTT